MALATQTATWSTELRGELGALGEVYHLYGGRIFRLARAMMGNADDAEDATQDIFIRLAQQADRFEGRSTLYTWLYSLAVRHCLNLLKQRRRLVQREIPSSGDPQDMHFSSETDPLDRLVAREEHSLSESILHSLSPEQRACIILRELEDLKYDEIAALLGIPIGTVMSRLSRARLIAARHLQSATLNSLGNNLDAAIVQRDEGDER